MTRLKTEIDGEMAERFVALCRRLDAPVAHVLRKMIWEFISAAESDFAGGGH